LAASTTLSMITALLAFSLLRGPYYWHVGWGSWRLCSRKFCYFLVSLEGGIWLVGVLFIMWDTDHPFSLVLGLRFPLSDRRSKRMSLLTSCYDGNLSAKP
jgi:hypothetical protein